MSPYETHLIYYRISELTTPILEGRQVMIYRAGWVIHIGLARPSQRLAVDGGRIHRVGNN
ncbi:MAG: hypothetical protein HQ477_07155 [Chloroflexi bacterium]|nr:hypothetical protein [Chloroflexota bacterium]